MTPGHLTTPMGAIETAIAPKRRSSRIRGVPQTARRDSGTKSQRAEEEEARDSNVRRGEDAVKTCLESEEKAKKSCETVKTYKN